MGAIKTSKLDNGMIGLEITYGGKDAPFGGIDTSAPPNYIDSNCFADASGFLVIDGQLIACGWSPISVYLAGWTSGMTYLDSGHFYQNKNYWNWALASTSSIVPPSGGNPGFTQTNFTIWTWQGLYPGTVPIAATLTVQQPQTTSPAAPATAVIYLSGPTSTYAIGGTASVQFNNDIGQIYPTVIHLGDTPAIVATNMANYLNTTAANLIVSAAASGTQVTLTTVATGAAANLTGLTVWGDGHDDVMPHPTIFQHFQGGLDAQTISFPPSLYPITWVNIGETLYIGGYGSMILQYSQSTGTPIFSVCTQYLGAISIGKFNSQLIAAGIVPGPDSVSQGIIQYPEMILGWSSPNKFNIWNPIHPDGTVTGAGYNQISDISDYLSGIFLTPGTAVILRTQGVDYITPLSGGISPFDFSHISNALHGEGCQHFKLVTEYDQIGTFIGNTNVYEFSGSLVPIGDKIKILMFTRPTVSTYRNRDSASGPFLETKAAQVLAIFILDNILFIYNFSNKTWIPYYLTILGTNVFDIEWLVRDTIPPDRPQEYVGYAPILVTEDIAGSLPAYWRYDTHVQNVDFPHATQCYVTFPQEEISFGRDITIESAYISLAGDPGQVINFWISNTLHAQLVLPSTASRDSYANYQIWFVQSSDDKTTIQNPQLSISLPFSASGQLNAFKISKIAVFGSFDPNQRPV